ncbi:conserved hypothetical protein [Taylorella asinigenitalis 14/45]|uniref:Protein-arginine rhamnosyltransferase n=1 Tax=Taylorella asinigenitalis 14/45 TaxID=1091495 RepID=I7J0V5_9BURK|nr:elongation factor P maturation arginine rhamnosyltransferase EarP [Taylorella asinigenitalis]CCG19166.1 conserved hypothetical protein [Taylorella asinigenitalis 14/45]
MPHPASIDVFCNVIDNFGDIGVSWRLCKDLAARLPESKIRLFTNKPDTLKTIEPSYQSYRVEVMGYHTLEDALFDGITPAYAVIEAFGCDLPQSYISKMRGQTDIWINLEYLSAEAWIESYHLTPSFQNNGVPKYFFMPGLSMKSGGLLCELDALDRLNSFKGEFKSSWINKYCGNALAPLISNGYKVINFFTYPHAPIEAIINGLQNSSTKDERLVFQFPISVYKNFPQIKNLKISNNHKINICDFVPHSEFDYLLQVGDLNFVRGEDSFVRAIWSGKPFYWNIYKQTEDTHLVKLRAWLKIAGFGDKYFEASLQLNDPRRGNALLIENIGDILGGYLKKEFYGLREHCQREIPDLTGQLIEFLARKSKKL